MVAAAVEKRLPDFVKQVGRHFEVDRARLPELLDHVVGQYIFSAEFKTRRDRKNPDGTVRPAGTHRRIVCRRKRNNKATKDWTPTPGGKLRFNPADHELYHVYTVEGKGGDDGTGNHWGFICMRSCSRLNIMGGRFWVVTVK